MEDAWIQQVLDLKVTLVYLSDSSYWSYNFKIKFISSKYNILCTNIYVILEEKIYAHLDRRHAQREYLKTSKSKNTAYNEKISIILKIMFNVIYTKQTKYQYVLEFVCFSVLTGLRRIPSRPATLSGSSSSRCFFIWECAAACSSWRLEGLVEASVRPAVSYKY